MDPYLEGWLWFDLGATVMTYLRKDLNRLICPKYIARVDWYLAEDFRPKSADDFIPPEQKIRSLHVLELATRTPVAMIEFVYPANKHGLGRERYLKRRSSLLQSGLHFLEIDLLRAGDRTIDAGLVEPAPYLAALHRTDEERPEIWSFGVNRRIPLFTIPLLPGDGEVSLNIQPALNQVYRDGRYGSQIDYTKPPPPPTLDQKWWGINIAN